MFGRTLKGNVVHITYEQHCRGQTWQPLAVKHLVSVDPILFGLDPHNTHKIYHKKFKPDIKADTDNSEKDLDLNPNVVFDKAALTKQ